MGLIVNTVNETYHIREFSSRIHVGANGIGWFQNSAGNRANNVRIGSKPCPVGEYSNLIGIT